ncbi:MAG: radical SAM protein [Candidatus Moranbacteria bacterium]|nr:radical SAM protein [Candidatus Moranbacteria bacterium]
MIRKEKFGGIIYNEDSGKVYSVDDFTFRAIELKNEHKSDSVVLKILEQEFSVQPDEKQYYQLQELLAKNFTPESLKTQRNSCITDDEKISFGEDMGSHFVAPIIIFWILTNKCNLRCMHCVQDSGIEYDGELSTVECMSIIDQFNEMGVCELSFSGGEPLSVFDKLIDIGSYSRNLGFKLSVATNAVLANTKRAKMLFEAGFGYAQVSIEGSQHLHDKIRGKGAFEAAKKGIANLSKEGLSIMLATTISDANKEDLNIVIDLAKNLGVRGVRFVRFLPMGRGLDNLDMFSISRDDELRIAEKLWKLKWQNINDLVITFNKHYASYGMKVAPEISGLDEFDWKWDCPAGRMRATIMPSGEITTCPLIGSLGLSGGNVRTHNFRDLWLSSDFFQKFREEKEDCIGCKEWRICKGGCKAWSYVGSGRIGSRDPLCFLNL